MVCRREFMDGKRGLEQVKTASHLDHCLEHITPVELKELAQKKQEEEEDRRRRMP
jgi:hypothetical protein